MTISLPHKAFSILFSDDRNQFNISKLRRNIEAYKIADWIVDQYNAWSDCSHCSRLFIEFKGGDEFCSIECTI